MSSLVGIGGFSVETDRVGSLERSLDQLAVNAGFPAREEFKWSPSRKQWMFDNLVGDHRLNFFRSVLACVQAHGAVVTVVASDTDCAPASTAATHEVDVTTLFIERAHLQLHNLSCEGVLIVERPGGGRSQEDSFLLACASLLEEGTTYVRPDSFALPVLAGSCKFLRCLQAADVVASASLACISGEYTYSPPVFEIIKPILHRGPQGLVGGCGLKLHPDGRFVNLYYWLLGETRYERYKQEPLPLPSASHPYAKDAGLAKRDA